jgi:N-acetylglucosamine-6-phosphate deacetylase
VLTLDRAVRNAMQFGGWNLQPAVRAATRNPAMAVGATRKGILEAGADADLVAFSDDGSVRAVIAKGKVLEN